MASRNLIIPYLHIFILYALIQQPAPVPVCTVLTTNRRKRTQVCLLTISSPRRMTAASTWGFCKYWWNLPHNQSTGYWSPWTFLLRSIKPRKSDSLAGRMTNFVAVWQTALQDTDAAFLIALIAGRDVSGSSPRAVGACNIFGESL